MYACVKFICICKLFTSVYAFITNIICMHWYGFHISVHMYFIHRPLVGQGWNGVTRAWSWTGGMGGVPPRLGVSRFTIVSRFFVNVVFSFFASCLSIKAKVIALSPSWELELRPLGVATGNAFSVTRVWRYICKNTIRWPATAHDVTTGATIHRENTSSAFLRLHWLVCLKKRAFW